MPASSRPRNLDALELRAERRRARRAPLGGSDVRLGRAPSSAVTTPTRRPATPCPAPPCAKARDAPGRRRAGDRVEQQRAVLGAARDRADGVVCPRGRKDAVRRHEAGRRPQAGDTAEARRDADRAAGVGAERAGGEVGRCRSARATARPAADCSCPRVPCRPEVRARGRRPVGELVGVQLAEHDRARSRRRATRPRRAPPAPRRAGSPSPPSCACSATRSRP